MVAQERDYFKANVNSALSTAVTVKAGVAGKSIYVQKIIVSVSADMNITIQDGADLAHIGPIYLAANGGFVIEYGDDSPLVVTEGEDLEIVSSAASAHTVHVIGYFH